MARGTCSFRQVQFHLAFRVLQRPVDIVELDLAELHVRAVERKEPLKSRGRGMAGKAQVPDSAKALLFFEIIQDAPPGIGIDIIGVFIDIV